MSLLNQPDALPAAMALLCGYLGRLPEGVSEGELLARFVPKGIDEADSPDDKREMLRNLMREAGQLGLIRSAEGLVHLEDGVRDSLREEAGFRRHVRQAVMEGDDEIRVVLSWFMWWDVARHGPASWRTVDRMQLREVGGVLVNDVRFANAQRWALWLGFGWMHPVGFVPDATQALAEDLLPAIAGQGDVPVRDLLDIVAGRLPVLDRRYGPLNQSGEASSPESLSVGLSLALMRLEALDHLRLLWLSDSSEVVELNLSPQRRVVSHIRTTAEVSEP